VRRQEGWQAAVISPPDDRSSMAKAMDWASRIIAISLEMVLPVLGGHWIDTWLGTSPWLLLAGFALGVTLAGLQLARIVSALGGQAKTTNRHPPDERNGSNPESF
jgi:F0F1-type ATP synthase assembly protein I